MRIGHTPGASLENLQEKHSDEKTNQCSKHAVQASATIQLRTTNPELQSGNLGNWYDFPFTYAHPHGSQAALFSDGFVLCSHSLYPFLSELIFRFAIRGGRFTKFGEGTAYASTGKKPVPIAATSSTIEKLGRKIMKIYLYLEHPPSDRARKISW